MIAPDFIAALIAFAGAAFVGAWWGGRLGVVTAPRPPAAADPVEEFFEDARPETPAGSSMGTSTSGEVKIGLTPMGRVFMEVDDVQLEFRHNIANEIAVLLQQTARKSKDLVLLN